MRWVILYNPKAKQARRHRAALERSVAEITGRDGFGATLEWLEIAKLPSQRELPDRLIAVGGDGTINAAASWIATRREGESRHTTLGIVPLGTGNNLARCLQLPLTLVDALELALDANAAMRRIDAVRLIDLDRDARYTCIQSAALGFPAMIAARYDRLRGHAWFRVVAWPFGQYIYRVLSAVGLVGQAWNQRRRKGLLELEIVDASGDVKLGGTLLALFVGNDASLGGDFFPCPRATLDDGLFDVCSVATSPVRRYPAIFDAIAKGTHVGRFDEIGYLQSAGPLTIESSNETPLLLDGDLQPGIRRLRMEVAAHGYDVCVTRDQAAYEETQ